ncbi:ABC transporter permease [Streptomyces sp. L2]|uniref:ABC transporter permease n=1 Tax=Streptomyces sp. L2 TaxID=2162665 RepID=UPI001010E46D|nr:ABC transporter permease [Streptomyces sp. L2]
MTTAPTTASPAATAPARPRQLRWLLRLHRPALLVWTGLVAVLAAALLWLGGPLTDSAAAAWQQFDACGMNPHCAYDQTSILRYKDYYNYLTYAVLAVPFLAAAWAGAALTGRELENGTAWLAWTQGVRPARWLAGKLAAPAAAIALGTWLLTWLYHRAWTAGEGRIDTAKPWSDLATFYAGGPVAVALALAGLATGVLLGLLVKRQLGALGGALCGTGLLWFGVQQALPHLWPTVTSVAALDSDGPRGSGITVAQGLITSSGARITDPGCGSGTYGPCKALYAKLHAVSWYKDYHPQSHFWPLHLMGCALLLAVAALLTVVAFRVLARRTAPGRPRSGKATKAGKAARGAGGAV